MSESSLPVWIKRSGVCGDRPEPYLCLHFVGIFVLDQERSLRFYLDRLGFTLVVDQTLESGDRWIEVAPPDGSANLALIAAKPGSEQYKLIGRPTQIYFLAEDVVTTFREWSERGVQFDFEPRQPAWGGMFTRFQDLDGNSFGLAGFDEFRRDIEAQRRLLIERTEHERRVAQELEIATQVQARLFPQMHPQLESLEYSGVCLQARQVGGDYYDFLDLGRERLGLVIGDISGKGMGAALLMANLQANLRGQSGIALSDPERFLRCANQLFYENTASSSYASLFFAAYDGQKHTLRYANCGHLPGLLLHSDNTLESLHSTSALLGLFQEWECAMCESQLLPGDILALYTDGVTEAFNDADEEFGQPRLIEALRKYRSMAPPDMVAAIVDEVKHFMPGEQHDDITLIVARCK